MITTLSPRPTEGLSPFQLPASYHMFPQLARDIVTQYGYGSIPEGYYAAWLSPPAERVASLMLHTVMRPDQAVHATHVLTGESVFRDGYYSVGLGKVMLIRPDPLDYSDHCFPSLVCERPISPQHMKEDYEHIL